MEQESILPFWRTAPCHDAARDSRAGSVVQVGRESWGTEREALALCAELVLIPHSFPKLLWRWGAVVLTDRVGRTRVAVNSAGQPRRPTKSTTRRRVGE